MLFNGYSLSTAMPMHEDVRIDLKLYSYSYILFPILAINFELDIELINNSFS